MVVLPEMLVKAFKRTANHAKNEKKHRLIKICASVKSPYL
jgi:hypothetical protein